MKCARCGKPLDKPASFVNGQPIGPKCWAKMGDRPHRVRVFHFTTTDDKQQELFDELRGSGVENNPLGRG